MVDAKFHVVIIIKLVLRNPMFPNVRIDQSDDRPIYIYILDSISPISVSATVNELSYYDG